MDNIYALYHDKEKKEMIIKPGDCLHVGHIEEDKIYNYNQNYFVCTNRKILREFSKELKDKWIHEAYKDYMELSEMKIKNKY